LADPAFAGQLHFRPVRFYADKNRHTRLYSELRSGDWWWETQLKLPGKGGTVIPIILSSDKTQLTTYNGQQSCYPVYLTIGNIPKHLRRQPSVRAQRLLGYLPIPKIEEGAVSEDRARKIRARLFHEAMRIICEPMFTPASDGVQLTDSEGVVRKCFPILAAYVADYPEQCLVTCLRYGQGCPNCETLVDDFDSNGCSDLRKQEDTLQTIRDVSEMPAKEKRRTLQDAGLNDIVDPFWADWPLANIHCAITSDVLHQLVQGVGKHLVEWLLDIAPTRELDARIQRLPNAHGLRHFKDGISNLSNVTGGEHRAIFAQLIACLDGLVPSDAIRAASALFDFIYMAQYECHSTATLENLKSALTRFHSLKDVFSKEGVRADFKLPKLHACQHYVHSITRFGTTDNYNTEATERLHIDLAKHAYRATNKREYVRQMCRWLERREAILWFRTYLAW
ncbi:hypothetical protein EXIGLDRAFT_595119, partial [Exidia glandulosa HHB12029]